MLSKKRVWGHLHVTPSPCITTLGCCAVVEVAMGTGTGICALACPHLRVGVGCQLVWGAVLGRVLGAGR